MLGASAINYYKSLNGNIKKKKKTGLSLPISQRWQALGSHQMTVAAQVYQALGKFQVLRVLIS